MLNTAQVWDFLSLTVLGIVAYPLIRYVETFHYVYLHMLISIVCCLVFIKATRHLPPAFQFMLRPPAAQNCSILNKGGSYANKIGMPSGHMLTASFVLTFLYLMSPSLFKLYFGTSLMILIGLSRYYKHCHTVPQIIFGVITGALLAFISFNLFLSH